MSYTAATADQIRAVTGSDLDDSAITPFITAAACVMTRVMPCMVGAGVSDDCLTQVQIFLSAHLFTSSNVGKNARTAKSEKFENYSITWATATATGEGILSSSYGQTANEISGGCLANANKTPASICFFG